MIRDTLGFKERQQKFASLPYYFSKVLFPSNRLILRSFCYEISSSKMTVYCQHFEQAFSQICPFSGVTLVAR